MDKFFSTPAPRVAIRALAGVLWLCDFTGFQEVSRVFAMMFSVVMLVNFYIGLHGRFYLRAINARVPAWVYWPVFWLFASLYIIIRWGAATRAEGVFSTIGAYWLGAVSFFLVLFLVCDLLRLANHFFKFLPRSFTGARYTVITGTLSIAVVGVLLGWGTWRARVPVVTDYTVSIAKPLAGNLTLVLVSDIHLGGMIQKEGLGAMVDRVNALRPDMILLAGDILDSSMSVYTDQNMGEEMSRLEAPLGVFAVAGNHEYFGGNLSAFQKALAGDGVRMLIDEVVTVGGMNIIGRNDFRGGGRKTIPELIAAIPGSARSLPLILVDHQPYNLEETQAAGIDLQLSGHTHAGQFWPITFITRFIYELNYGLLRKGKTTIIVTSGYGLWGPPLRIGSKAEIVRIKLEGLPAPANP
ncbi:MAG: metallophosphoesterase [Spirochaetaceae bacterium]|nr:metallophosphoesterase [Spirochaetaceae bacterium]